MLRNDDADKDLLHPFVVSAPAMLRHPKTTSQLLTIPIGFPMPEAKPRRRWRRVLKCTAVAIFGLLTTGVIYEQIMRWRAHYTHPPKGEMIAVGGRQVNIRHEGKDLDGPTVVLEAGITTPGSTSWGKVRPGVSEFAPVVCYDRAGLGWSEPSKVGDRTSRQLAKELRDLLQEVGARPPYLLVGHSFGGHHVRAFASQYPNLVAGMVLIDVPEGSESEFPPVPGNLLSDRPAFAEPVFRFTAFTGVMRFMLGGNRLRDVRGPQTLPAQMLEVHAMVPSEEQGKSFEGIGNKPLIVLPAKRTWTPYLVPEEKRLELQQRLLQLSTDSKLVFAENSGHQVQFDEPDLVVNAIREVWNAARSGNPLVAPVASAADFEP